MRFSGGNSAHGLQNVNSASVSVNSVVAPGWAFCQGYREIVAASR